MRECCRSAKEEKGVASFDEDDSEKWSDNGRCYTAEFFFFKNKKVSERLIILSLAAAVHADRRSPPPPSPPLKHAGGKRKRVGSIWNDFFFACWMFVGQDERLYRGGSGLVRRVRVGMTSIGDKVTDCDVGRIIQVPKALVGIREPFSKERFGVVWMIGRRMRRYI